MKNQSKIATLRTTALRRIADARRAFGRGMSSKRVVYLPHMARDDMEFEIENLKCRINMLEGVVLKLARKVLYKTAQCRNSTKSKPVR